MNLRQLQAFKIVLDEGSITYAAERFGITQPAMSNLIGNLEGEIGFALFDRHKGRLRATPEAMQFSDDVDQVLNSFDKVVRTARDIRDLNRGQLRIASFPRTFIGLAATRPGNLCPQHTPTSNYLCRRAPAFRCRSGWLRSSSILE